MYETLLTERRGRVGVIGLNRPRAMNALNKQLMEELAAALRAHDSDPAVGAIVIHGNEKAFAAGADIKEMAGAGAVEMLLEDRISLLDELANIKKPVIAAVSGWCLGGGNEVAMACDMIVAAETARFGQPEVTIGVIPGAGGTQRLTRAVGKAIAMEMVLNNRTLTADEALRFGLVNRLCPAEQVIDQAVQLAEEIADRAPLAVRLGKEAVLQAFELPLKQGIAAERRAFYFLFASQDQKEGMAAFSDKRPPDWHGR
jgi:enoyl-CoA hydratase